MHTPNRVFLLTFVLALSTFFASCAKPIKQADDKKKTETKNTSPSPVLNIKIKKWPPDVQRLYSELRSEKDANVIIKKVLKLGRHGGNATEALYSLYSDKSLPDRQRNMSGILYADIHRYAVDKLVLLLDSDQQFVAQQAALHLAKLGTVGYRALNDAKASMRIEERKTLIQRTLAQMKPTHYRPEMFKALDTLLANPALESKQWASTELAVRFIKEAESFLIAIYHLSVSDRPTKLQATVALTEGFKKNFEKLKLYTDMKYPFVLRFSSVQQLLNLGKEGNDFVVKLSQKDDSFAKRIRPLLKGHKS